MMPPYEPVPGVPEAVRAHLSAAGTKGALACTALQAAARAQNGRRGGRPVGAKDSVKRKTPNRKKRADS